MKINTILLVLFTTFLVACNSSVPKEEKPNAEIYTSKEIGWTIEIPKGFKSLSDNRIRLNEQKGKEAIGNATKAETKTTSLVHFINFQKNQFNLLMQQSPLSKQRMMAIMRQITSWLKS